jgi:hypothetical protein
MSPVSKRSLDDLGSEQYETISEIELPDNGVLELRPRPGCQWHTVDCCGKRYTICMKPGVWYCCRNGSCKTCYQI